MASLLCICHNEPMTWNPDARRKAGGTWLCAVRKREAGRKWQKQARQAQVARAIEYLGGECVRCGATTDLHCDHIDPSTKLFNIGQSWKSWARVEEELKKCQLLCNPCHGKKTWGDQQCQVSVG